ncbi:hypothetical protein CCACVL1_19238 [Corchorus capsularis]|uniref:Uncharacterized protein n=1 Tax=Corchorus capsularis TaxID=210143 RepID=A0A1R3HHR1_COCAP|nr:hypothetical protein CCACVL1_19238 [Corchorus capsularis]
MSIHEEEKDKVIIANEGIDNPNGVEANCYLIGKEYDGEQQLETMVFDSCPFWVNVHGVPFKMLNEKVRVAIGETMGNVLDIKPITGRSLRIRIDMDLRLPFKNGTTLSASTWDVDISFVYDKQPDHCWVCGRVDHQESDCAY